MSARTRFNITINEKFSGYGFSDLTTHLYLFPVVIGNDYVVTGVRATDSHGNPIVGTDKGDGQYGFEDVAYNTYCVVAYKSGILPQVVNGYDRFMILPKLEADETACSATDTTILKTKLNTIIQYLIDNSASLPLGTPPTLIT